MWRVSWSAPSALAGSMSAGDHVLAKARSTDDRRAVLVLMIVYLAGLRARTVNPSPPSTLTAPVFPPSNSPELRRSPVANS